MHCLSVACLRKPQSSPLVCSSDRHEMPVYSIASTPSEVNTAKVPRHRSSECYHEHLHTFTASTALVLLRVPCFLFLRFASMPCRRLRRARAPPPALTEVPTLVPTSRIHRVPWYDRTSAATAREAAPTGAEANLAVAAGAYWHR